MSDRPNILWISLEDTSPRFGCYGHECAQTPNLDRLASEGRRYDNAFTTAPVCAPARHAVITGRYAISNGAMHMRTAHTNAATPEMPTPYDTVTPHYVKCFSEYLRAAGYYCTNNQKTDYQFRPPPSAWHECSHHGHWRNRPDPDQPFFAVFNYDATHESKQWPEMATERITDPQSVPVPPYLPDTPRIRLAIAQLYDHLHNADTFVGERLKELEEDGLKDNTVVVVWSDHGEGLPRHKRWPYDTGLRVPLIVRWPGQIAPGEVSQDLISTLDLGPTMLSLAGVSVPRHMQGQVFLGPKADPPRQYVYASRDRYDESYDMVRVARDARFLYMRHFRPDLPYFLWVPFRNRHPAMQELIRLHLEGKLEGPQARLFEPRPAEELYDCEKDPHQIHNLAEDPAHDKDLKRLRDACEAWRTGVGDMGEIPEAEMVRRWRPDGEPQQTAPIVFIPLTPDRPGIQPAEGHTILWEPCAVQLHCATQGASILWTTDPGDDAAWQLYTEPLRLPEGMHRLRAKACRIGFTDSEERALPVVVRS